MEIVIPYNMRTNYLKITLTTLKEALRTVIDFNVRLYNTNPKGEGSNLEVFDEINNLEIRTHIKSKLSYEQLEEGQFSDIDEFMPKIISDALKHSNQDFILLMDADTVVHPQALEKAVEMCQKFPDLGAGTLFNSAISEFSAHIDEEYGTKKLIAGFGLIINRNAWLDYCKRSGKHWETDFLLHVHSHKDYKTYCTRNSYLEHIGFSGLHKTAEENGHPMSIDRAVNFFN